MSGYKSDDSQSRRMMLSTTTRDILASDRTLDNDQDKRQNFIQRTWQSLREYSSQGSRPIRKPLTNARWLNSIYEDGCIMDVHVVDGDHEHGEIQYRLTRKDNRDSSEVKNLAKDSYDPVDIEESLSKYGEVLDYERDSDSKDPYSNFFARKFRKFLIWTHTSSVIIVFFVAVLQFILFTCLFVFLIYIGGFGNEYCLWEGGMTGWKASEKFIYLWATSWTTFSTVGYGYAYPSTPGSYADQPLGPVDMDAFRKDDYCVLVNMVCSMESLIGILFVGFWSAILFAKVHLYQMDAKVLWSNNMIIMYAPGKVPTKSKSMRFLRMASGIDESVKDQDCGAPGKPCPVLLFRLANQLHEHAEGEIMNASINVVALINKDQVDPNTRMLAGHAIFGKAFSSAIDGRGRSNEISESVNLGTLQPLQMIRNKMRKSTASNAPSSKKVMGGVIEEAETELDDSDREEEEEHAQPMYPSDATPEQMTRMDTRRTMLKQMQDPSSAMSAPRQLLSVTKNYGRGQDILRHSTLDPAMAKEVEVYSSVKEDESDAVPNMVYTKLNVTPDALPTFRRVWVVGHVLDEFSPLLTEEARNLVKKNGGNWPHELDSIEKLKKSIAFDSILVSFTGVPKVTAEDVFDQHVYDWDDTKFGFSFKSMLFRDAKGKVVVDETAIDDMTRTK